MIIKNHFREDLKLAIATGHSLNQIVAMLKQIRDAGVSRQEALDALQTLRSEVPDEATEDRVLEVMDIVSGWCSPEDSVWAE